jgi:putative hydroxymethylpyrimidine transport system substrate-binding protein
MDVFTEPELTVQKNTTVQQRLGRPGRLATLAFAVALSAALVTACGSDPKDTTDGAANAPSTPTKVTFAFNFPPGGAAANLVATAERGYFRDQGLDVTFVVPGSTTDATKLVASGDARFGTVDGMDTLLARAKDVPIVSVATTHQYGAAGILAPAELHVTSPKQLEGLTVGVTGIPGQRKMLETVIQKAGGDVSKVEIVDVGFAGVDALLAGKIDVFGDAIYWAEPIGYNLALGKPVDDTSAATFLRFDEWGAPRYYTNGVVTSQEFLKENPETVRKFLKAFDQGLEWTLDHPAQAIDLLIKKYPENKPEFSTEMLHRTIAITRSPETEAHVLGWQDPAAWQALSAYFQDQGIIDKPVSSGDVMTNAYLPQPQ